MTNPKHTDTSRSGDPVAWMYEYGGGTVACTVTRYEPAVLKALGYTETPLYPADRIEALEAENERLREALGLADAALRGANMNMNVVERKVRAALGVDTV